MLASIRTAVLGAALASGGCANLPAPDHSAASTELRTLIDRGSAVDNTRLLALYDQLPPVDIDFLLGQWRGGKFDGGTEPDPINWYGKRFDSRDHAEPLLARAKDGSIYAFDKLGAARLRMVHFRGALTASLIYDRQPIMDYFRKVDENTVIGVGEVKGQADYLIFHLQRDVAEPRP